MVSAAAQLGPDDPRYPASLRVLPGGRPGPDVAYIGNVEILARRKVALFCSVECPGSLIIGAHDLAQALRRSEIAVVSGFQSPVEQECLTILLDRKRTRLNSSHVR